MAWTSNYRNSDVPFPFGQAEQQKLVPSFFHSKNSEGHSTHQTATSYLAFYGAACRARKGACGLRPLPGLSPQGLCGDLPRRQAALGAQASRAPPDPPNSTSSARHPQLAPPSAPVGSAHAGKGLPQNCYGPSRGRTEGTCSLQRGAVARTSLSGRARGAVMRPSAAAFRTGGRWRVGVGGPAADG